jgi:hypothetical protein
MIENMSNEWLNPLKKPNKALTKEKMVQSKPKYLSSHLETSTHWKH